MSVELQINVGRVDILKSSNMVFPIREAMRARQQRYVDS